MKQLVRIGLDIAKSVFQLLGVDSHGKPVCKKTLSRGKVLSFFVSLPSCLVGIEACAGSHYWARELIKLGHDARLMAAQFVSPYRKSGKNDANDAEAICEAVGRPYMRFVPVKSEEAQAVLSVHRARALTVSERTALINQVRGLLGEFGIVTGAGTAEARKLLAEIGVGGRQLPLLARETIGELHDRFRALDERILAYDRKIAALARQSEAAQRLMAIAGRRMSWRQSIGLSFSFLLGCFSPHCHRMAHVACQSPMGEAKGMFRRRRISSGRLCGLSFL
ncbi:MAG: IS110 family transposase [Zoogloea sp.]|nr:IS110 family transposase [Zoogloea sp.]MBN8285198.1 IS110 family transposase [Zoogloea sp.]